MVNTNKIKGRIREKGYSQASFAKMVDSSETTVCKKINNKVPMTLNEAAEWSTPLGITDSEFGKFFFYHPVA